ncbi:MAG: DUF1800 domain-containing protein, partial [bacterium]
MSAQSKIGTGPLKAYTPTASQPWDPAKAAHLLNRAGFGGTPDEIDRLVKAGYDRALDDIVNYEKWEDNYAPVDFQPLLDAYNEVRGQRFNFLGNGKANDNPEVRRLQQVAQRIRREKTEESIRWWYNRMVTTKRPLQEKMVLFWHGHLTSSIEDVENPIAMYNQNEFFRQNTLGKFRDILIGISKDPAMLRYLDNNTNRKEHPNENYARELLELFSMGVGHYTDFDVKEAARAFTGWSFRGNDYAFNEGQHDYDEKTFLGHKGNFDGSDIIDIVLEQPPTADFMARKLLKFFAFSQPDPDMIQQGADILRKNDYEFRPLIRALLQSQAFYSDASYRSQVKSPVQLVVGALRQLNLGMTDGPVVPAAAGLMGQMAWAPPNVKGWDGGLSWINTSTLLIRYNFMNFLVAGQLPGLN